MAEVFISSKSCQTCENTVESAKFRFFFTVSKAAHWAGWELAPYA